MTDNIVALPGFSVPGSEPVKEVIEILEEALEKARSGKLQGAAVVMVERNPDTFELAYYGVAARHTMVAGVAALLWRVSKQANEGD